MYLFNRKLHKINWHIIANVVGYVLIAEAALLLLPVIVELIYQDGVLAEFCLTIFICLLVGIPLSKLKAKHSFYFAKDGMIAVGLSWIFISLFGCLPFFFTQEIPSFVDCFFESVSGFTTTGSSILTDVEALSHASLFWRSFMHLIGGMGILVFILALVPRSNDRNMHIMRAEAPGPVIGKLVPRLKDSAAILYKMYITLVFVMILFLLAGNMPLFDALCTTFGTAGTGGFAIKSTSIAYYNSAYIDAIVTCFMFLFGINFNLFYFLCLKKFKAVFSNEELKTYVAIVIVSIFCITLNILPNYNGDILTSIRLSAFQVASIVSTTGYSTTDFNYWPSFSKSILLILMVIGACAGSTAGGLKVSRLTILLKKTKLDLQRLIHPQKVEAITMDGKIVSDDIVHSICSYFFCLLLILASLLLIVSLDNFDMETNISSCFTCLGNVGPGFGLAGPLGNFAMFSDLSKMALATAMLIGRLEIFPILIFIAPLLSRHRKAKKRMQ